MFSSNNKFLDLRGSFVNLEYFGVAHQLLSGIFWIEAIPAEDLDAVCRILVCNITRKELINLINAN